MAGDIKSTEKAELIALYGIEDLTLKRKCSDTHLLEMVGFISWGKVGHFLPHIDEKDLNDIEKDSVDTPEKRQKLLTLWEWRNGDDATYDAMITAMLAAQERLEAVQVLKLLQQGQYNYK